jgi:splicing factor 1
MTSEQLEAYVTVFRVNEITEQLRAKDLVPSDRPRSPSPEPEYDGTGRRTNTREQRYRKRLEEERRQLVDIALRTIPAYVPPYDHRRLSTKISEKVYLPVTDFPGVSFIGQILGPRGSSLKAMNAQSGANVVIRGRGSVKEGKGRARQSATDYDTEPLHCLITADSQRKLNVAKKLIQDVIDTATCTPDYENNRKQKQLQDLAIMNGTFRDDENQCGQTRASHLITFTDQQPASNIQKTANGDNDQQFDCEYQRLMLEIQGGPVVVTSGAHVATEEAKKPLPPWRIDRLHDQRTY